MITRKIKRMFTKDETQKLQLFIEEVNENDELKAKTYANRSSYVHPSAIRLGCQAKQEGMFTQLQKLDHCPV